MLGALTVAKLAAQVAVSLSTAKVVAEVIKHNVTLPPEPVNRAMIKVGGLVLGGVVGDYSAKYIGTAVDNAVAEMKSYRSNDATEIATVEE